MEADHHIVIILKVIFLSRVISSRSERQKAVLQPAVFVQHHAQTQKQCQHDQRHWDGPHHGFGGCSFSCFGSACMTARTGDVFLCHDKQFGGYTEEMFVFYFTLGEIINLDVTMVFTTLAINREQFPWVGNATWILKVHIHKVSIYDVTIQTTALQLKGKFNILKHSIDRTKKSVNF